ncbi:universal stress protein [Natrialbaceae archaeon A-CW3]
MKFLVAVDGSNAARNALTYAAEIADAMDASITAVHAIDPEVFEEGGTEPITGFADAGRRLVIENIEATEERGLALLEDIEALADDEAISIETVLLYGDPVTAVTDYAEDVDADTIFVGHRGRSERTDLMLGSVAKSIVERATVPVTVVR